MGAALRVLKICMVWAATAKQANAYQSRLPLRLATDLGRSRTGRWRHASHACATPVRPARLGARLALVTKFKFRAGDTLLDFGSGFKPLRHVVHHLLDHWKSGVEVILV